MKPAGNLFKNILIIFSIFAIGNNQSLASSKQEMNFSESRSKRSGDANTQNASKKLKSHSAPSPAKQPKQRKKNSIPDKIRDLEKKANEEKDPISQLNIGLEYYSGKEINKNLNKAFKYIRLAVDNGYLYAKYCLGYCHFYAKGEHKKADYGTAFELLQEFITQAEQLKEKNSQSAKSIPHAAYMIGLMYYEGKGVDADNDTAIGWFRKAAHGGDKGALDKLNGLGLLCPKVQQSTDIQNYQQGFDLLKAAAERKNSDAYLHFINMYLAGHIGKERYEELFKIFLVGVEQNNKDAEFGAGYMKLKGHGTSANMDEAGRWFFKAANKGHEKALSELEKLAEGDDRLENKHQLSLIYRDRKDYPKAEALLRGLIEKNYAPAFLSLGEMHEKGHVGNQPNYVEAYNLYARIPYASKDPRSKADFNIGNLLERGLLRFINSPSGNDYQNAIKFYGYAATPEAYYHIGKIYEKNLKDPQHSISNYKIAASKGHQEAQLRLETISSEGDYAPWDKEAMNGLIQALLKDGYYNVHGFSSFFQETASDDYPFKLSQLIVMKLDSKKAPAFVKAPSKVVPDLIYGPIYYSEQLLPYEDAILAIDPSGKGEDETAYCVAKRYKGTYFITALGGCEGGYKNNADGASLEVCQKLIKVATDQEVSHIYIENNASQGYANFLRHVGGTAFANKITDFPSNTSKRERIIDTLEPLLTQGRLIMSQQVLRDDFGSEPQEDIRYKFFYQFTSITLSERRIFKREMPHEDRLDALAMAVKFLRSRDPDEDHTFD